MERRGANWCDVIDRPDGAVDWAYVAGPAVIVESAETGTRRWQHNLEHALLYLSADADGHGRVLAAGPSHDDGVVRATINGEQVIELGLCGFPFGVLVHGLVSGGWIVFIQRSADWYDEILVHTNGTRVRAVARAMPAFLPLGPNERPMPPTSQGFLYVGADGLPVRQDDRRIVRGLSLPSPARAAQAGHGTVWAGQSRTALRLELFDETTGQLSIAREGPAQPPHIVQRGDDFFMCAYVDGAAWVERFRRPLPAIGTPPVVPPVVPPPVTPPQEGPVRLEQKHSDLIDTFAARFPPPGGDEDALRDHWTPKLIEQFVFTFPGEGWCWKSTSPGGRPSSDVIARRVGGGAMWGYDVIPGAGTPGWSLNSHAGPIDLRTQAPIPMNPVNHLGAAPPVTPPTTPPVTPPAGRPFPAPRWPEDVFLHALTRYINEGLYERDKPIENAAGTRTSSRGGLMWFVPIATEELIADIVAHGNQAPTPARWWALADRVAVKAIDFYRRTAPPE